MTAAALAMPKQQQPPTRSTDEAMEYLQSISRSATCSSIPCLMPAFDNTENIQHVPTMRNNAIKGHIMPEANLGEGVTARFVSIENTNNDDTNDNDNDNHNIGASILEGHDLSSAPKDQSHEFRFADQVLT